MRSVFNLWQSPAWKAYQESLGREVRAYEEEGCFAQVVIDRTAFGYSTWDIPRGPIGPMENGKLRIENAWERLLQRIMRDAQDDKCIAVYFSPEIPLPIHNSQFIIHNSSRGEHPTATRIIDLAQSEENILAQMKPKGRYNIRIAEKHGVAVEQSTDIDAFYALLQETGGRDGFGILPKSHYEAFLKHLDGSFLLLASPATSPQSPVPIAGLLGVIHDSEAYYYYGASSYAHRAKMAPYALQWAAMRHCKVLGAETYDLLGIVPPNEESKIQNPKSRLNFLESGIWNLGSSSKHPWTGVSAFKEKFGGTVKEYPQEQMIVLRPFMLKLLQWKRKLLT